MVKKMWRGKFLLIFAISFLFGVETAKFKVTREWNHLNFTWPDEETYRSSISRGLYVPQNNIVSGVDYHEDYFYLTLPRMKSGVPASLARIPAGATTDTSPLLEPFPSWEMNKLGDCSALQNVQNVEVDSKGQLWIIDSGRTETLDSVPTARCRPKLMVYDVKKNSTVVAYTFPEGVADMDSNFLYDIVVDDTDGGYAYITDNSAKDPGIVVFSMKDHHSWKIRHSQSMRADPSSSTFRVNNILVQAPINIAGIALGPKVRNFTDRLIISEDRDLYYSPLSSLHLYSINTSVLRMEMNGGGEYQGEVKDYGLKGSQSVGMIMDNRGTLYYSLLATNSIAKWDSHTPFETNQKIIARDPRYLEWPNSFTFDQMGNITVLVNRLDKFIYESFDLNEANFRLITSYVDGKSYVYDQSYDYDNAKTTAVPMTNAQPGRVPEPHVLTHSDQDPNLMPHVVYTGKETTVEPKPEPEPEPEPSGHDHDHHDHHHDGNATETQKLADSSADKAVSALFGTVVMVFLQFYL